MALAGGLAVLLYAFLWVGIAASWPLLSAADDSVLGFFHSIGVRHPGWTEGWRTVSDVFGPGSFRVMAAVGIAVAVLWRRPQVAGFLIVTVMLSGLVTAAAKGMTDRPRPATALTHAASSSFPSGHALGVTVGVLAFGALLWPRLAPAARVPAAVAGVGLIVLVGMSRVVLNVHHPSDVLAGWALGVVYYLVCARLMPPRSAPPSAEAPPDLAS